MLKDPVKMQRFTEAIVRHTRLPVTVKTRLGWDASSIYIEEVAERLQDAGIAAIAIHGRTRAQMYTGSADWQPIARVKNNPRIHIPVFGNGDVNTPEKAVEMRDVYGLDGAMIGRASIGNPWFFKQVKHYIQTGEHLPEPHIHTRVEVAKKHLQMAMDWNGDRLGLLLTRKHYTNYFKALPGIKEYRLKLLTAETQQEVFDLLDEIEMKYQ